MPSAQAFKQLKKAQINQLTRLGYPRSVERQLPQRRRGDEEMEREIHPDPSPHPQA